MRKQLIVVVHGVGVKEAGVTTDLLSAALADPILNPDEPADKTDRQTMLRPHSSDDFRLTEGDSYAARARRPTFPARIRRFRAYNKPANGDVIKERVIADFYWGDVAVIGSGVVGIVVALFKIILGLSHVVRENAASVFPGTRWPDRALRRLAEFAVLTVHGPIAAFNILILSGLCLSTLLHWTRGTSGPVAPGWHITAIVLVMSVGGYALLYRPGGYLYRLLFRWLLWASLALVLSHALTDSIGTGWEPGWRAGLDDYLKTESCRYATADAPAGLSPQDNCADQYQGLFLTGLRLFATIVLCWSLVFGAAAALGIASLVTRRGAAAPGAGQPARSESVVFSSVALMTLLWFVMASGAWAMVGKLPFDIIPNSDHVNSALRGLVPALAGLILLTLAGIAVHLRNQADLAPLDPYPKGIFTRTPAQIESYRLIVSRTMCGVLALFLGYVGLITLLAMPGMQDRLPGWLAAIAGQPVSMMSHAMVLAGILAVVVLGAGRAPVTTGLATLADIIAYLNNYSWDQPDRATPAGRETATTGFRLRRRIQDRLRTLVVQLLDQERPDQLILVSHSQGTVIALDVIDSDGADWRRRLPEKGARLGLVTMGSPYTHLYNHYFHKSFPSHLDRPALAPCRQGGVLNDWTNIFRIDDFIGTFIDSRTLQGGSNPGQAWPEENPLQRNGHTMYWVDDHVAAILRLKLAF